MRTRNCAFITLGGALLILSVVCLFWSLSEYIGVRWGALFSSEPPPPLFPPKATLYFLAGMASSIAGVCAIWSAGRIVKRSKATDDKNV